MTQEERLDYLISFLLAERGEERAVSFGGTLEEKRRLLRGLMNLRPPLPADSEFLSVQDSYLAERGIVRLEDLTPRDSGLYLWQGDITTLAVDGIVNAANSRLLGCFVPSHRCIDNAIHTFAGVQLRLECARLMEGKEEPIGRARLTGAYNLPCRYVLHTVGPIVTGAVTQRQIDQLADCYRSCLELAHERGLSSLAFCCLSTGEFRFPRRLAAEIALATVRRHRQGLNVVFNVFLDQDREIYEDLLR